MPYQADAGSACGENFVNPTNDSYGNGYFDGFSVVGGHEYAEAQTDPVTSSGGYAWEDARGSEIGDKCAWSPGSGDITLGSNYYAVQPLWSNANSGCVMSH
jgi:serine protease